MASAARSIGRQLTFRVGDQRFALPIGAVREVVRRPALTRVPHAPDSLIGLANLRGTVLPVVSLAVLVGGAISDAGWVIVLAQADPVGILVDHVSALTESDVADDRLLDVTALLREAFGGARSTESPARLAVLRAAPGDTESDRVAVLGFVVGGQEFALPLEQVDAVTRLPREITLLPGADAVVIGTIARDGKLLPLLALDRLLGLTPPEGARRRVVVARIGAHRIGLVVDAVRAILRIDPGDIDPIPAALARGGGEANIQAICRLDGGRRLVSILAADHLLHTNLHLAPPSEGETTMTQAGSEDSAQFLIFRLGDQEFGLPIAVVTEVTALPDMLTRLPRAPAFVEGVMNLRGQVVPVIDQHRRFLGDAATGKRRRVIVVALNGMLAGFVVDTVSEVARLPASALRPAPELGGDGTRVFDRIATPGGTDRMILIVEPRELLDRAERDLLAGMEAAPTS